MSADGSAGRPLKIFINYRRDDTQATAWLLYGKLTACFGTSNVFFDRKLPPGVPWPDEIRSNLGPGGVLLALVGQRWMETVTSHMRDGGEDYVAKEIDLALRGRGMTVIPVLTDDARLPDRDDLPPSLQSLLERQAETLRPSTLDGDIDHLIAQLKEIRSSLPAAQAPDAAASPAPQAPEAAPTPASSPSWTAEPESVARRPDEEHYRMVTRHADNLVVFLGAGANADDREKPWSVGSGTLPDDRDLARYLASHAEFKNESPNLAEVAQYTYATYSEQDLFDWVTKALRIGPEPGPGPVHRYLAQLPARLGRRFQMIVTPKYDAALERALKDEGQDFDIAVYMAPGTEQEGRFVHLSWERGKQSIEKPNEYRGFPITAADCKLDRTVIVRINGAVADKSANFSWDYNCVITEDHYINYMSGRSAEEVVPVQILAKLRKSSYLFLGYTIADWRLRVFLQRIRSSQKLGRAQYWAVEPEPDALTMELWEELGVRLYQSRLTDYLAGLYSFLGDGQGTAKP